MAFPAQHGRAGNGVGLVDVPNSAYFSVTPDRPLTEENITQWALRATGDYLFREVGIPLTEQVITCGT